MISVIEQPLEVSFDESLCIWNESKGLFNELSKWQFIKLFEDSCGDFLRDGFISLFFFFLSARCYKSMEFLREKQS